MPQETKTITLEWKGDLRFVGGEPGRPAIMVDGDNAEAPGPMAQLLMALAACTGSDVVHILRKMRSEPTAFRLTGRGTRREEEPRRYVAIHLTYHLAGPGLDDAKVRRAIELSQEKYCSVIHSLAPDIRVTHDVELA